jgi:hypothetical protein
LSGRYIVAFPRNNRTSLNKQAHGHTLGFLRLAAGCKGAFTHAGLEHR